MSIEREDSNRRKAIKREEIFQEAVRLGFRSDPAMGAFRPLSQGETVPDELKKWININPIDETPMVPVRLFGPSPLLQFPINNP